jgi:tetratricopeptide (TPR) repeat protein
MEDMDKIALLTEILQANPADSFARYGLAMEYLSQNNADKALEEFALTTDHNPDYVPAYQMSGQTLAKLHRNDEATARLKDGLAAAQRTSNRHATSEMQALLDELELGY